MKRYIKASDYEVDEHGYPTYDGVSFVSDSDMLEYIADDETERIVTESPLVEYDVVYVDNDTDMVSHYNVVAPTPRDATRIAKRKLGRDCYQVIAVVADSKSTFC